MDNLTAPPTEICLSRYVNSEFDFMNDRILIRLISLGLIEPNLIGDDENISFNKTQSGLRLSILMKENIKFIEDLKSLENIINSSKQIENISISSQPLCDIIFDLAVHLQRLYE
ncbi:MAG: hypothetical protein WC313_11395 [Candidatus Kapaibacterium sp.]